MKARDKTEEQLINELAEMRRRVGELESTAAKLRETEKALKESEERFRLLYENAPLGYQSLDENGYFLEVNQAWLDTLGYSREEVLGKWFGDFLAPGYQDHFQTNFPKFKAAGEIHWVEFEMLRKDGIQISVAFDGQIGRDQQGRFKQTHCILHDISEIKRSQDALKDSEERYRAVVDNVEVGISLLNANMEIVEVNKAMKRYFPHVRPACGQICYEQYNDPPRSEPCSYCPCALTLKYGKVYEAITETPAGSEIRYYHLVSSPIKDSDGRVQYVIELTEDITERRKAEEAADRANKEWERTFKAISDGIMVLDCQHKILRANKAMADAFGVAEHELLGKSCFELVHGAKEPPAFCPHSQLIADGEEHSVEVMEPRLGGTYDVRVSPITDQNGQVTGSVHVTRDISDRKRVEQALLDSEERLRLTLEATQIGIWDWDVKTDQWYASPIYYAMLGYESNKGLGDRREWLERVHPDDRAHVNEQIQNVLRMDFRGYQYEARLRHADGTYRWQHVRGMSVKCDEDGKVTRMLGIRMDVTERKRAEEALQASEEKYRTLFEESFDGLFVTSPTGKILDMNKKGVAIFGYDTKEEMSRLDLGRDVYAYPVDRKRILAMVEAQGSAEYEVVVKKKNGELMITQSSLTAVRDEQGAITTYRGIIRDITERKRVEEALRAASLYNRSLIEASLDPLVTISAEGKITDVNRATERVTGYARDELIGTDFADYFTDSQKARVGYQRAFTEGIVKDYELEIRHRDGGLTPVMYNASVYRGSAGEIVGLFAAARDISRSKQAEEKNLWLAAIVESSDDAIIGKTLDGTITSWNKGAANIYGYQDAEVLGKPISLLVPPDRQDEVQQLLGRIRRGEHVEHYETVRRKKGEREIDVSLTISPIRTAEGRIMGASTIARDITEQKSLQRQLLHAQKMESIGTLAGGIAHDFNNLLTVVLGFSELLLIRKDERDPAHADLKKINQAARSGADLVQRILAFSTKTEINPRPLNLNHEIEQAKKLLARTIPKMIEIELALSDELATVNADPVQIEQVLMNLAVNARDAMPDGGKLTIETKDVALDEEYCRMHLGAKPGDYVLLSVSDTGHGMDKETLSRIFEPFYTTKGVGRGTGLGLSMVYGIVKQHGGYITCYSEPGMGTTFKICLPVIPAEGKPETPEDKPSLPRGTERILLVDDDEFVRDLGKSILEHSGYTVLTAAKGKEALNLYKKERGNISLVILDLIMPEMGGKECLKGLLKIDPRVKVLIASGYAAEGQTKDTIETGARGFVGKPYNMRQMLQAVREVLDSD
jgi:two-component system, cell cycle sensor histidine kinase and response regulator CckA